MAHGGDLPEELVFRILVKLPVKSLLRFACVCKLWHDVILRDRNFARDQLAAARELTSKQPSRSHKRLLLSTSNQRSMFHVLESPEEESEIKTQSFRLDAPETLLGSCNGFVFATTNQGGKWVSIWNPARYDVHRTLPDPEFDLAVLTRPKLFECSILSGAGYVSATDDYKLLIAYTIFGLDDDFEVIEGKLYSLRSNSWKSIDCSDFIGCHGISTVFGESLLHWIDSQNMNRIQVFDLGNEECRSMSPPDFQGVNLRTRVSLRLGVSAAQGCLTLISVPRLHPRRIAAGADSFMEFWVMKEYGVAQSWTMLYRIVYTSPWLTTCVVVMETCTVARLSMLTEQYEGCYRLIRINHKEEREQQFRLFDDVESFSRKYSMLEYEESLIS